MKRVCLSPQKNIYHQPMIHKSYKQKKQINVSCFIFRSHISKNRLQTEQHCKWYDMTSELIELLTCDKKTQTKIKPKPPKEQPLLELRFIQGIYYIQDSSCYFTSLSFLPRIPVMTSVTSSGQLSLFAWSSPMEQPQLVNKFNCCPWHKDITMECVAGKMCYQKTHSEYYKVPQVLPIVLPICMKAQCNGHKSLY